MIVSSLVHVHQLSRWQFYLFDSKPTAQMVHRGTSAGMRSFTLRMMGPSRPYRSKPMAPTHRSASARAIIARIQRSPQRSHYSCHQLDFPAEKTQPVTRNRTGIYFLLKDGLQCSDTSRTPILTGTNFLRPAKT